MSILKKAVSLILVFAVLVTAVPAAVFAETVNSLSQYALNSDDDTPDDTPDEEYSISNGYLTFSYNKTTGGFAIETVEGNPQKVLDDFIPLIYSEDRERSNGTSFITVRIGDKDYIFGQDYSVFGIESVLGTVEVKENGRLIEIPWTVDGIKVTLSAALDSNTESNTTGNVGLSFKTENLTGEEKNVGIRLLLDTALGNSIDSPYFVVDTNSYATITETEYTDDVPMQIRSLDSLTNPTKLSYIIMQADGWNGGEKPTRVILGHWANLANTRYEYTPDPYCDFSNYSNKYRRPDSAVAIYWDTRAVLPGDTYACELLYGVGNFSKTQDLPIGISITAERVELAEDKVSYARDGLIEVAVDIDNTVDNASELAGVVVRLSFDEDKFMMTSGESRVEYLTLGNEIQTLRYTLRAIPQTELCAGTIYVSLSGVKILDDGSQVDVEAGAERSLVLPSVTNPAEVQLTAINPKTVYTDGEKAVTVSGKMKSLRAALASDSNSVLKLVHTTTGEEVAINKNNIAFIDDNCETLAFSTTEPLWVGEYEIVFELEDRLAESLNCKSITCETKLEVSADPKYKMKSYGLLALVRMSEGNNTDYDYFAFNSENEYLSFYRGESSAVGKLHGKTVKHNFGKDRDAIKDYEILITIRGAVREMQDEKTGETFWQADYANGDVIINNILSYEGEKPLKIHEDNNEYIIEGDGLIKVVGSINVWRSEWTISTRKDIIYSLDTQRLANVGGGTLNIQPLQLSLEGAASMIQSIGGFAVSLKYGELSSAWYDETDGMVTYGIGFGGSISLPIKSKEERDLTADQEDISEDLNSLFAEANDDTATGNASSVGGTANKTSQGEVIKKETELSEGQLSASVNNVMFGENGDVKNGIVEVEDIGFIGIDTTISLALPKDLLGSLVSNAPGIYASMTINTIDNVYEIEAGLNIKIIECEGILAFKETTVKKKQVIVPDRIEFYIRDGLKIPLAPPALFIAGLGGGISELADTIGGEFDTLPPLTILLFTRLEAIGVLTGDFNARVSLEGITLDGDMRLKIKALEKLVDLKAGISARWVEPWELSLYGNISIIDGIIKGGITVTIADNYFYGYVFASFCIPGSIPLIGGKELGGVEAAVSDEFIGANIRVIGIKFGVIYYWGDKVSFGSNIDLTPPAKGGYSLASDSPAEDVVGYYGTNIHLLETTLLDGDPVLLGAYSEIKVAVNDADGQDALLLEIPYSGTTPTIDSLTLINPDSEEVELVPDDGNGGGNILFQARDGEYYIYVTVTDSDLIKNGEWTLRCAEENTEILSVAMNGVDDIPELDQNGTSISANGTSVTVGYRTKGIDGGEIGTIDVYLTEDKDILKNIQTSENTGDVLGVNILHKANIALENGKQTEKIELPDSLPDGKYYAVTVLSMNTGISLAISDDYIDFVNPNLPKKVDGVKIAYGGNGEIFVSVTDAENPDYTHYLAEIVADDGTKVDNALGQFEAGKNFVFGDTAPIVPGKTYHVNVKTLREEYKITDGENKKHYYYGTQTVSSNDLEMPEIQKPVLEKVEVNFATDGDEIITDKNDVVIEYTFANDVFVEMKLNGGHVYAFGKDPQSPEYSHFRKDWKFVLDDLDDGDYIVDFTAYTASKDHIKGSETDVENAYFAFTVDTSAPVLSLAEKALETEDNIRAVFGANTVIADKNGKYTIEGITEKNARLFLDGKEIDGDTDGVTLSQNGAFKLERTLDDGEMSKEHILRAVDRANNSSELRVYAVRGDGFAIDSIELYVDGEKIKPDSDVEKRITVKNGGSALLSVYAFAENGRVFSVDPSEIEWNVMYSKNAAAIDDGKVTALAPGETAVRAKLASAVLTTADGKRTDGLTDYVVIKIENNSKSDLASKLAEAKRVLSESASASSSKKNALQTVIDEAEKVLNNADSTPEDYTSSVNALDKAIADFKAKDTGGRTTVYTVKLAHNEHGTACVSHDRVYGGNSVTVTATPDEGYVVYDILVNGKSVGGHEVYTIASVRQNTEITVVFAGKASFVFDDVNETDWFCKYVDYAYQSGLMIGTSKRTFEPDAPVTRAMFVTILHRLDGSPEPASRSAFTDVARGEWYTDSVAWAYENGIVNGVEPTLFAPDDGITREQIAAIMFRYAKHKGIDVTSFADISRFIDSARVSDYALDAVKYAVGSGLINGTTEITLSPLDFATRAEIATVIMRFAEANN